MQATLAQIIDSVFPTPQIYGGPQAYSHVEYSPENKLGSLNLDKPYLYEAQDKFSFWEDENGTTGYKWMVKIDPEKKCGGKKAFKLKSEYDAPNGDLLGAPGKRQWNFKVTNKAKEGSECNIYFIYARKWEIKGQKWWKNSNMPGVKAYKVAIKDDESQEFSMFDGAVAGSLFDSMIGVNEPVSLASDDKKTVDPVDDKKKEEKLMKETCQRIHKEDDQWMKKAEEMGRHTYISKLDWCEQDEKCSAWVDKNMKTYQACKKEGLWVSLVGTPWDCANSKYPTNFGTCWANEAYFTCGHGNGQWAYDQVMAKGGNSKAAYELQQEFKKGNCPTCNVAKSSCIYAGYPANNSDCWARKAYETCDAIRGKAYNDCKNMFGGPSSPQAYCKYKELVANNCMGY